MKTLSAGIAVATTVLLLAPLSAPSVHAEVDVTSQVTDAVTQPNVKVVGESPAMAMGSLYQTAPHSTGILFYNAVQAQASAPTSATTLSPANVQALMAQLQGRSAMPILKGGSAEKAKAFRKIDAITSRLRECGDDCIINMQIHVQPWGISTNDTDSLEQSRCDTGSGTVSGAGYASSQDASKALVVAACIATRMLATLGEPVDGVAVVIPDGDRGIRSLNATGEVPWRDAEITSIDLLVQRLL